MRHLKTAAVIMVLAACQPTPELHDPAPLTALERYATSATFRENVFYDCSFPDDIAEPTLTGRMFLGIESPEFNGETMLCHSGDSADALECASRRRVGDVNLLTAPAQMGDVRVTVRPDGAAVREVFGGNASSSPHISRENGACLRGPAYVD